MKYYLDTEFHERKVVTEKGDFDTIELISIGIVSEKGDNFYEICKEFDVKAAWDNEWLRENVLLPIFNELVEQENEKLIALGKDKLSGVFDFDVLSVLIDLYGYTRKQLSESIQRYVIATSGEESPEFYAYYADYDWVVFCWIFGRMIDLPKGYPMYCRDLKQMLDKRLESLKPSVAYPTNLGLDLSVLVSLKSLDNKLSWLKTESQHYPKNDGEHNALFDARWNWHLHEYIEDLVIS